MLYLVGFVYSILLFYSLGSLFIEFFSDKASKKFLKLLSERGEKVLANPTLRDYSLKTHVSSYFLASTKIIGISLNYEYRLNKVRRIIITEKFDKLPLNGGISMI